MQELQNGLIAVDWGTTNCRAYLLDAAGNVVEDMENDAGVSGLCREDFPDLVQQIIARFGDWPLLMAGMVGSNRGWRETPYVSCPVTIGDLARSILWVEPGRIGIVPGVALSGPGRADVMRGEEVQILGLIGQQGSADMIVCHPGTHTKWVRVTGGAITDFRTFMTGELFALLCQHSILAPLLQSEPEPDADFLAGVDTGLAQAELAAELFSVRARVLLDRMKPASAPSWVSGLLVGSDVRGGLASCGHDNNSKVTVLGRPSLNRFYAAALDRLGVAVMQVDGASAFIAGIQAIRKAAL